MSAYALSNLLNQLWKNDENVRLAKHFIAFLQQV